MSDLIREQQSTGYNYAGEGVHTTAAATGYAPVQNPMPSNTIRPINIQQLSYGYIVNIGCQTFAIENAAQLITKLSAYILQPAETEKMWNEGKLF